MALFVSDSVAPIHANDMEIACSIGDISDQSNVSGGLQLPSSSPQSEVVDLITL